jgi:hypothetical protein
VKRICIDFDGVIHAYYDVPWTGETSIKGAPVPGAKEAIQKLKAAGHKIIVNSARFSSNPEAVVAIQVWLEIWGIPYDVISLYKPYADIYLDDRALCFNGDWAKTVNDCENFKPWCKDFAK